MGRQNRIELPNTIYHIINRGNNKSAIFQDKQDYNVFLKYLRETQQEKNFLLYCYCLMPNHFHLLIETLNIPASQIMQKLLTSYAIYFNSKYKQTGHVFQGRYRAKICKEEGYLFKLVQYIHLNPLRAKLATKLENYKWTSHQCYLGNFNDNMLSLKKIFNYMGCANLASGYKTYINLLKEATEAAEKKHGNYRVESDELIATDKKRNKALFDFRYLSLDKIIEEIATKTNISIKTLLSNDKSSHATHARKLFYYIAVNKYDYSLKEVSNFIKRDVSVISRQLKGIKSAPSFLKP